MDQEGSDGELLLLFLLPPPPSLPVPPAPAPPPPAPFKAVHMRSRLPGVKTHLFLWKVLARGSCTPESSRLLPLLEAMASWCPCDT